MCVPITQSEVKVELIASFVRHSNLVGSQLMIFGSKDHELHFIRHPTKNNLVLQ
jgi:hypothetical protein